jgi:hypothetical protein
MNGMQIRIKGDEIRFIYSDSLKGLMAQGQSVTRRASHVEPEGDKWVADMSPVNGPKLGPFDTRGEALKQEVAWLQAHDIPAPTA